MGKLCQIIRKDLLLEEILINYNELLRKKWGILMNVGRLGGYWGHGTMSWF